MSSLGDSRVSTSSSPFPLPAIQLPHHSHSHSRRNIRRFQRSMNTTMLANSIIHSLNQLNTCFSSSLVSLDLASSSSARNISSHPRMLAHIYSCATRYVRCRDSSSSSDDTAFSSSFLTSSFSYSSLQATALPLIASKVSLPSSVGSANLIQLLPSDLQQYYSSPSTPSTKTRSQESSSSYVMCFTI